MKKSLILILSIIIMLNVLGCSSTAWERDTYYNGTLPEKWELVNRDVQMWIPVPTITEWGIQVNSGKVIRIEPWWRF